MVYSREIEEQVLTFGVSGQLLMNGLVMYDHQTDSLWSQVTGSAISGDFENTGLRHLAALQTTWAAWVQEHPETIVLDKGDNPIYDSDPYASYYDNNSAGLFNFISLCRASIGSSRTPHVDSFEVIAERV